MYNKNRTVNDFFGRSASVISNAVRSTSFEITVVAIVRVLLVMEKRVRSTSFSITSIWTSTMLLLVIDRVLARVQLPWPKNSRYQDDY